MRVERLLVVVAHPDDETFGCGSFLAHAADRGVDITVACATRGEAGEPAEGSGIAVADLPEVREAELRAAAEFLAVGRVELFDWADSGMDGDPDAGTLCAASIDDVAAAIVPLIDEIEPTVVLTLDASDGHRDHVHMRDATLAAVDRATWRTPRTYLHCLPQALMRQWAEIIRADAPESAYLAVRELGTPPEDVTTVIDTSDVLDRREAAIALHRSQTSPYEVMPQDLRNDFLTAERLRRVRPPWDGGDVELEVFDGEVENEVLSPRDAPAAPTPG